MPPLRAMKRYSASFAALGSGSASRRGEARYRVWLWRFPVQLNVRRGYSTVTDFARLRG
jgi:hypothetical protein